MEETHPRNKERVINFSAPGQFPLCRGTVESWPSSLPSFLPFLRGISPAFVCFDHASKVWQPSTRAGQDSAFLIPKRWPKFKLSEESKRFEYSSSWEGLFRRSSVSMRSGFFGNKHEKSLRGVI